jgi:hypothetical protein
MPGITYTTTVFTGAGLKNLSGQRVSYQWFGYAPDPGNGTIPTTFTSLLNGTISIEQNTPVATAPTTAFNGFVDGWSESTTVSGSVEGYVQPSSVVPTVSGTTTPFTSTKYYFKVLIGSVYYAGFGYFSSAKISSDVNEIAKVSFEYTLVGIPTTAQIAIVTGGSAPPTT